MLDSEIKKSLDNIKKMSAGKSFSETTFFNSFFKARQLASHQFLTESLFTFKLVVECGIC